MDILTNVSVGEFLDKISILEIKEENISDENKLIEIKRELGILRKIAQEKLEGYERWISRIKEVNQKLWKIEDDIREKERNKEFDQEFIELARSVYYKNDERFKIKDEINQTFGSIIKEQKSYKDYN